MPALPACALYVIQKFSFSGESDFSTKKKLPFMVVAQTGRQGREAVLNSGIL